MAPVAEPCCPLRGPNRAPATRRSTKTVIFRSFHGMLVGWLGVFSSHGVRLVTARFPVLWKRMFFVPINTDAPVYHFPWATISLIVANTLAYLAIALGFVVAAPYVLTYGSGLHPLQWVTSIFIHDGFLHLAGNMFFLWVFGLIVEGKLGWRRFLPVFLGLGVLESAMEQLCLQNMQGSSLGASAAIVGLMGIALVWAPRNEIVFAYGLLFSVLTPVGTIEISVVSLSLLLASLEVVAIWWLDVHTSAAVLHLLGSMLGLGLGVTLLKQGGVDCEGWDLLSVWADTHRPVAGLTGEADRKARRRHVGSRRRDGRQRALQLGGRRLCGDSRCELASRPRRNKAVGRVRELVGQGKPGAALREWQSFRHFLPESQLERQDLRQLAKGLYRAGLWQDAVTLTEEYVSRFDDQTAELRVWAATALLYKLGRPRAALNMLEPVDFRALPHSIRLRCRQLVAAARALVESGVMELSSLSVPPSAAAARGGVGVEASSSL